MKQNSTLKSVLAFHAGIIAVSIITKKFYKPANSNYMNIFLRKSGIFAIVMLMASLFFVSNINAQTTTLFLKNTHTNPGTGGFVYDLSLTQGSGNTVISTATSSTTFAEELAFTITNSSLVSPINSDIFYVSVNVNAVSSASLQAQFRLQRVNSSGVVQASTGYSTTFNTVGIKTATLNFASAQTWASSDRLRLSIEVRATSGSNRTITVNTGNANSFVQYCSTPSSTFNVTGGGSYCSGGSGVAIGLSGSQTGVNYQLYVGATPVGSVVAGTGSAISFGNQTTAGSYTVTATSTIGSCSSTMSGSVTITINASPTISLGANPSVCSGTTSANLSYTATTGSPNQYSIVWSGAAITAGFVNVTNAVLPATPIVITVPGAAAAATYTGTLTVTNSTTGCISSGSAISVIVNSGSTPNIITQPAANLYLFQNCTSPLSVTVCGTVTSYQWYSNTIASYGGTLISGATTSTYSPPSPTAGTSVYYYVVINGTINSGFSKVWGYTTSLRVEFTQGVGDTTYSVNATNCGIITGGGQNDLDINYPGGDPNYPGELKQWQYSIDSGTTWVNGPGPTSTTNQYVLDPLYTNFEVTPGKYWFRLKITLSSSGCYTVSNTIKLTVTGANTLVGGSVSANQSFCSASGVPLPFTSNSPATGGSGTLTYQWQSSTDDINFSNISGATATTYSSPSISQTTYFRRGAATGGCGAFSDTLAVLVNIGYPTISPATITGPLQICVGTNAVYSISVTNADTCFWSVPSGFTIVSGLYSNTITVSGTAGSSGTISVYGKNSCGISGTVLTSTINVYSSATITGTSSFCQGTTSQLTGSGGTAVSPFWTSATPSVATVNGSGLVTGAGSGTSIITYYVSTGCNATYPVTVNPTPTATGVTICQYGNGSLTSSYSCQNGSSITVSKPAGLGATSNSGLYTIWSNPTNIYTNNSIYASCVLGSGNNSEKLSATSFGFSIPSNATIVGVIDTIYVSAIDSIQDYSVNLTYQGNLVGTNQSYPSIWPTAKTAISYGGSNSIWGLGSLTPTIVNDPSFGVMHVVNNNAVLSSSTANVDYIQLTIFYTLPGSLNWYTVSSGGSAIGSGSPFNPVGVTGSGLPNTNTPGTYTFYVECSSAPGCRDSAFFVINAIPTATISGNASFCAGGNTLLNSNATAGSGTISSYQWYLGGVIIPGATSSTYSATAGGSYTVVITNSNGCSFTSTAFVVTVNTLSIAPTGATGTTSICNGSSTTLTVTGGTKGTGALTEWFTVSCGGTSVGTGDAITVSPTSSTIYYVRYNGTCNITSCAPVSVTVNAIPSSTGITASNSYICTGGTSLLNSHASAGSGTISSYQWYLGGVIIPSATSSTYTASAGGSYTVVITNSNGCSFTTAPFVLTFYGTNTWFGTTSNANLASNWSCGSPTGTLASTTRDIIIPASPVGGNMPVFTADDTLHNITFTGTGSPKIFIGANTLTITGAITGNGALSGSSSSNLTLSGNPTGTIISFAQDSAASRSLYTFNLVKCNNGANNISLGSNLDIYGDVIFDTSNLNFNGQHVTLKSDANYTATIGNLSGSTLTGATNVTVERFIPGDNAKGRRYRLLTPTVTTTTTINANWQEGQTNTALSPGGNINNILGYGVQITGAGGSANGFDVTQTNQSSLFLSSNGMPNSLVYTAVTNTNSNKLNPYTGYYLFVRGSRAQNINLTNTNVAPSYIPLPSDNTTLRATGTLVVGDINSANFTNPLVGGGFGYVNLITNPYACPIDWAQVYSASSNITNAYYLWDANDGSRGGFVTVSTIGITNPPGSLATQYIQPGQAFYVACTGTNTPVINIKESHKVQGPDNIGIFTQQSLPQTFTASVFYYEGSGSRRLAAGATAVYGNYSAAVDSVDAIETPNWDENIAINRQGYKLAIEARPLIVAQDTLPLFMNHMHQMTYEYEFTGSNFSDPNIQATLIDNYTGYQTPLNVSGTSVVPFTINTDAASNASDRFMVVFGPAGSPLPVTFSSVKAYQKNQGIQVDWEIQTEQNIAKYEVEKSADGLNFSKIGTVASLGNSNQPVKYGWFDANPFNGNNFYRIKSIDKSGNAKYSVIVKVNISKGNPAITIYPNPVTNSTIAVQFTDMPKGIYHLRLINNLGQVLLTQQVNYTGGSSSQNIGLNANIINGNYRLEIIQPDNTTVVKSVTVLK